MTTDRMGKMQHKLGTLAISSGCIECTRGGFVTVSRHLVLKGIVLLTN